MAKRTTTSQSNNQSRSSGAASGTRVLLVDSDGPRARANRSWLETRVGAQLECANSGDEALDVLGAAAQQLDGVVFWPWLADDARVDFPGVLRRCKSPLKLMAVTSLSPTALGRAGRLAGVSVVDDDATQTSLVRGLETLLTAGDRISDIVATRRVPLALTRAWAEAIYGAGPGRPFHAPLD